MSFKPPAARMRQIIADIRDRSAHVTPEVIVEPVVVEPVVEEPALEVVAEPTLPVVGLEPITVVEEPKAQVEEVEEPKAQVEEVPVLASKKKKKGH